MKVKDFMIRNPVCAYDWQPVSFVRQNMLANSYSYLPVLRNGKWKLVSDLAVSKYLQSSSSRKDKKKKLTTKLEDSAIELINAKTVYPLDTIQEIVKDWDGLPICVTSENSKTEIVGILTAFDLL